MRNDNIFVSILVAVLSIVLIWFALKAALFVGWAVGGGLGIILAILFLFGILDLGWLFGLIAVIILINLIFGLV